MKRVHNRVIVAVGFWLAVAILVGIGVATHQSTVRLLATGGRVERARRVTENLHQIRFALQDAETQTRELVATDAMTHQKSRLLAAAQVQGAFNRLRKSSAEWPAVGQDIAALEVLATDRLRLLDEVVQLRNTQDRTTAIQLLDADRSRALASQIDASIYALMESERQALLVRDEELKSKAHISVAVFVLGCFVSLSILSAVFLYLNVQIAARRAAEAALAREKKLLEQQYRRHATLAKIELAINQPHELQSALDQIAHAVSELMPAEQGSVIVWENGTTQNTISSGQLPATVREQATRWIVEHKQTFVVPATSEDPFGTDPALVGAYAGVPLLLEDDVLGVLFALDKTARQYRDDEMEFLEALAARAALAISKVRLYDQLRDINRLLENRVRERTTKLIEANEQLRRDERELRESEERYRNVVEGASDMIYTAAPSGQMLTANRAWLATLGYSETELPGLNCFAVVHPESRAHCEAIFNRLLTGEPAVQIEAKFVTKDGRSLDVEGNATVLIRAGKVISVHGFFRDVTARKHAEQGLHELSGRLLKLQDEERRHIARELHDVTAQNLSAITLNLARIETLLTNADARPRQVIADSVKLAEECLREIRTLSYVLHPPMLDEYGLPRALEWFLEGFTKRSGIRVVLDAPPAIGRLPDDTEMALFRIVQASLSNIRRHADCHNASICLTRNDGWVTLQIQDDGHGFREPLATGTASTLTQLGVGITGMKERLRQLGGRLDIESTPTGTTVRAVVPVTGEEPDDQNSIS